MLGKFAVSSLICVAALAAGGCSQRLPLEEASTTPDFSHLASPLDLRQFEVVASAGGYRGVFLRLSRFPERITTTDSSDPGRIILDIAGPTGEESPEESFPGGDTVVSQVRVTRYTGLLRITLDLSLPDPPEYSVHRMADWIMIRMKSPQS
jgi:hypothetical protein